MKIAIISDIHDNLVNLEKCLNWCRQNKIKKIICCGDITNNETLNYLAKKFKNTIHLVKGNVEIYDKKQLEQFGNINYYGKIGRFKLDGKIVGICHELYFIDKILESGKCDMVFYGHNHKPWIENIDGVKIVNPGELAGMWQKSTFAFWDTKSDKLELKILEKI